MGCKLETGFTTKSSIRMLSESQRIKYLRDIYWMPTTGQVLNGYSDKEAKTSALGSSSPIEGEVLVNRPNNKIKYKKIKQCFKV